MQFVHKVYVSIACNSKVLNYRVIGKVKPYVFSRFVNLRDRRDSKGFKLVCFAVLDNLFLLLARSVMLKV